MNFAIAIREGDELRLEAGRPANGRPSVIVAAPSDYHSFVLEVPSVDRAEMDGLLRYRLRAVYPGDVSSLTLGYHKMSSTQVVVVAMERRVLAEYRRLESGARLVTAETLALARAFGSGVEHGVVAVAFPDCVVSLARDPYRRLVDTEVRAGTPAIPVAELVPRKLAKHLEDFARPRHGGRSWWLARVSLAAGACLGLIAALVVRDVQTIISTERVILARHREHTARTASANETLGRLERVEAELGVLPDEVVSPYRVLQRIAKAAGGAIELTDISIRGGSVQMQGLSAEPLDFADRLSAVDGFRDVALARVQPEGEGRQRFTLSTVYEP